MPVFKIRKKTEKNRFKDMRVFLFLMLMLAGSSCYKRVEGCIDPLSSNFNPNADDSCDDCCKNPFLKMTLKHQLADTFYSPSDSMQNDLGQWYKLLDFSYYLSGFTLSGQDGQALTGERFSEFVFQNQKKLIKDNFLLIRPTTFDYSINEIRQYGTFDSLIFIFGLEDSIRRADVIHVEKTHVLSDSIFIRDGNGQKSWCNLTIAKGVNFSDTLRLSFALTKPETVISLAAPFSNTIGKDLVMTVIADYAAWFGTTDLNLPEEQLKETLRGNLKALFRVK